MPLYVGGQRIARIYRGAVPIARACRGAEKVFDANSAGSAAFSPLDLASLFAWFRADLGVTKDGSDRVSQWADLSGNGLHVAQATEASRPVWHAEIANGKPALRFDGANDSLFRASFSVSQPFYIFTVLKIVSFPGSGAVRVWSMGTTGTEHRPTLSAHADEYLYVNSDQLNGASVGFDDEDYGLFVCRFHGASSSIALNGGSPSSNGANLSRAAVRLGLGAGGDGISSFTNVEIAEWALLAAPEAEELAAFKAYFNARYALW